MNEIDKLTYIWVFKGEKANFPSGVFSTKETADEWIKRNKLTGVLTKYPVNVGVYDWAIDQKLFTPKKDDHYSPLFIGKFTSASMEHYHYEDGDIE